MLKLHPHLIHLVLICDSKVIKNNNSSVAYHTYNNGYLTVKKFNDVECQFLKVLLSGRQVFVNFEKGFWFISSIILFIFFYIINDNFWLNLGKFFTWPKITSYRLMFRDSNIYVVLIFTIKYPKGRIYHAHRHWIGN